MVMAGTLASMFLWVVGRLFYEQMVRRSIPSMDGVDNKSNKVRRDSLLTAAFEEFHLKALHQLMILPIQEMSRGNGLPLVSHLLSNHSNTFLLGTFIIKGKAAKSRFKLCHVYLALVAKIFQINCTFILCRNPILLSQFMVACANQPYASMTQRDTTAPKWCQFQSQKFIKYRNNVFKSNFDQFKILCSTPY